MFFVDKYYQESNLIASHKKILDKLLESFNIHNMIYRNIDVIIKKPKKEFNDIIDNMEHGVWKYANFPHLLVYGPEGCGKEYIVNKLLENIYGKKSIELNEVEYTISGYSSTKTKVLIKQSNHHIVIEPNNNGFDKYLIQEIIEDYAKIEILSILKYKKLFKVVIIDKIDDLSYYAQASLRRTMEKYANTCKFIFISNQLSKINEPLKSRCLTIRVPLPTDVMIMNIILTIDNKEELKLSLQDMKEILARSDNNINRTMWMLDMKKYNVDINKGNWTNILDTIAEMILSPDNYSTKNMYELIKTIRELLYILFITNIDFHLVIRKLMILFLSKVSSIDTKYRIIDTTSLFELRIAKGTRYIIQMEAYLINIIAILNKIYVQNNSVKQVICC